MATFSSNYIEAIKEYSIGMELNHTCISECLDPDRRSELMENIRTDLAMTGECPLVMHGPFTEIYPAAIDYRMRDIGMERLNQAYEVAKELGISKMIVHTGWLPFIYFKEYQAEKGAAFWQKFMADKPANFQICIENVLEDEPMMLLSMMERIKDSRIGICLDIGHANAMTLEDYPVEEWIRLLAPYITHLHLHNNDGTRDSHSRFDLDSENAMNMDSIFECINKYLKPDVTMTIESQDSLSCLEWLKAKNLI